MVKLRDLRPSPGRLLKIVGASLLVGSGSVMFWKAGFSPTDKVYREYVETQSKYQNAEDLIKANPQANLTNPYKPAEDLRAKYEQMRQEDIPYVLGLFAIGLAGVGFMTAGKRLSSHRTRP